MIATIFGYAIPLLLAPVVIWSIRPLFSKFFSQAAQLLMDVDCAPEQAQAVGMTMAKVNGIVFMLMWLGVFTCLTLELPIAVGAAIVIVALLVALWLTTGIARKHLRSGGWESAQVGLVSFAGGNLPMLLLIPLALVLR